MTLQSTRTACQLDEQLYGYRAALRVIGTTFQSTGTALPYERTAVTSTGTAYSATGTTLPSIGSALPAIRTAVTSTVHSFCIVILQDPIA
jgi:hypothetical protein